MTTTLKKIDCKSCGADLIFDVSTQLNVCNFCGSTFEIKDAKDESIDIDGLIPFKVSKEEYHQTILEWLSSGEYTPDDILISSAFMQINGIYIPLYRFRGKYTANWSASSGYDRKEEYQEWSELNKRYITHTRTVTDWRPSNGQVSERFEFLVVASKNLTSSVKSFCEQTTLGNIQKFDSRYLLGFGLNDWVVPYLMCWKIF